MIKYNYNFCKTKQDGSIEYAPMPLRVVDHHHEEYDEAVYDEETGLPVIDPATGEQQTRHVVRDWDTYRTEVFPDDEDFAQMGYMPCEPPKVPRTFSKLKLVAALKGADVWPQVKELVEAQGLYDYFLAAQDFAEDNIYFKRGLEKLQTELDWSDEQVEAVLAASVAERV